MHSKSEMGSRILYWCMVFIVPTLVLGDYQIEFDLRSYNNTGGMQSDGTCCDATIPNTQPPVCLPSDTCDTRLTFSVRNLDTNAMFPDQTKTVGDYDNADVITFSNCSQLINGQTNPLVFAISPSSWGDGNRLRFTVEVIDIDFNPQTMTTDREEVASILIDINRPAAPSATFTNFQNYASNLARLELRYRVICTSGTCGSTCSQTTSCTPFQSSCGNDVIALTCDDNPCQNGGTCNVVPGGYMCDCVSDAYSGINCQNFNACYSSPCLNGGTCTQPAGSNSFMCDCPSTHTGPTCGEIAPTVTTLTPVSQTTSMASSSTTSTESSDGNATSPDTDLPTTTTESAESLNSQRNTVFALVSTFLVMILVQMFAF